MEAWAINRRPTRYRLGVAVRTRLPATPALFIGCFFCVPADSPKDRLCSALCQSKGTDGPCGSLRERASWKLSGQLHGGAHRSRKIQVPIGNG